MDRDTYVFLLGLPITIAALIAALRVLWATVTKVIAFTQALEYLVARVDQIEQLLTHELTHNHGSSIKDDVVGTAVAVGVANRRLNALEDHINTIKEN